MGYKLDPNYKSMSRIKKWDVKTQEVIQTRLENELADGQTKFQFLTQEEGELLKSLIDIILPGIQASVKVANAIDGSLSFKRHGVKYGLELWSGHFYKKGLALLLSEGIIKDTDRFKVIIEGGQDDFLTKFVRRVLNDAASIYYSHPASWDKIGFPGPAFPEGYGYLKCGQKEEWEPDYKYTL